MNYFDLLRASKRREGIPSMEKIKWSRVEEARAEKNICVHCGEAPSGEKSFLCPDCESGQSCEAIRDEIALIRKRILGGG